MSLTIKSHIETIMLPPATVDEYDPLTVIAKVLLKSNKGCVFVTSAGEVVGIITERDILRLILKEGGIPSDKIIARDFMVKPVITIPKNTTLANADELMARTKANRLAVVEKEGSLIVVGFINDQLIRNSIKAELIKTLKKRQTYSQED